MSQVYDEPIVVRLTVPVGSYPVGTEFGFNDVADAIRALGSSSYFTVVRTQDGDPIPPPTPEDIDEARRQAMARARAARLVRGGEFDSLASVALDYQSLHALDIWPEFNANGGAGSWNAQAYTDYIAGLDASLSGQISSGTVVKRDLGASSGTERIYSYTAGNGPIPVLIVAGQHGQETLGMWAAMRWFQQFVTSNDASCRRLRNAFRVTLIPALNASRYNQSRTNANGVDTNRNFDWLWARFADGDTTPKGAAPLDQPENGIIKTLFDTTPFRHVIDCHNYNPQGDTVQFGLPGHYLLGPRQFGLDTARTWEAVYGAGASWSLISSSLSGPNLVNYANYRMRHQAGRTDSTSLTLEASGNIFGSVAAQSVSRAGVRAYAGMIHTHLLRIMENGYRQTVDPYSYSLQYYRASQQASVPIADGGSLVSSTTDALIRFTHRTPDGFESFPHPTDSSVRTFDVPVVVAPAKLFMTVTGALRTMGTADGRFSVKAMIDGTNTADALQTVTVPMATGTTAPFAITTSRHYSTVSNTTVPNIGVAIRKINGGDAELLTLNVIVTVMPHTEDHYVPRHGTA